MKRILTIILSLVMLITITVFTVACGNGDPAVETTSTDTSAEAPPPSEYDMTEPHQTVEADISLEVYSLALTVGEISGIIHTSRPLEISVNQYLDTTMEIQHYDSEDYTTYEVEEIIIQGYYEGNEMIQISLSLREEHAHHGIGGATAVMIDPQTLFFRISIPDEQSAGTFTLSANSSIRYDVTDVYRHSLVHSDNHQEIGDIMELEYNPQQLAISCDYIKIAESLHSPYAVELTMSNEELNYDDLVELVRYFPRLHSLNLYRNRITDLSPLTGLANLKNLSLSGNYTLLSDYSLEDVEIMLMQGFDIDIDDYIAFLSDLSPLAELHSLETLTLGGDSWLGGNIIDISALAGLTNLTSLNLQSNEISDITVLAGLTNLESLNLSGNNIIDLSPLAGLTNLETLNLDGRSGFDSGNVSDLSPLASLTNLTSLNLNNNEITDISPLARLINLELLHLDNNEITDITILTNLTSLTSLELSSTNISDFAPLSYLTNLERLSLTGGIGQGFVGDLGSFVSYSTGQFTDLTYIANLTNLEILRLTNNDITDLTPLTNLTNLTELIIWRGQVTDVSPLANLTQLESLVLTNNRISDISPLVELTRLNYLDLGGNQDITDWTPVEHINIVMGRPR